MDTASLITPIITALVVFAIQQYYQHKQSKREKAIERRAEAQRRECLLTMRGLKAIDKLTHATADAVKHKRVNGIMDEAIEYYKGASDELTKFLQEQSADSIYK